jgi:hypothetical protein
LRLIFKQQATTEPGTYYDRIHVIGGPEGAALIAPGQQTCWQVGIHHPGYAPHEALVQTGAEVIVYRDYDKSFRRQTGHITTGWYGINQHFPACSLLTSSGGNSSGFSPTRTGGAPSGTDTDNGNPHSIAVISETC